MTNPEKPIPGSAISDAIRAKRERRPGAATDIGEDIAVLEAALLADIDAFDLDAAESRARQEQTASTAAGMGDSPTIFPTIAPTLPLRVAAKPPAKPEAPPLLQFDDSSLLSQLRQQAEIRQRELHTEKAERTALNEAIDHSLKRAFSYLHEFVQQLNIVKAGIPRHYPLAEHHQFEQLVWQEGFTDYRSQSQSAGALLELVSFSYQLAAPGNLLIERDGPAVDRFRNLLFDYGLQFDCKEFKNPRRYVERAEFDIRAQISVSVRWRADFANGCLILETRNLERLGSSQQTLSPLAVDQAMLDEFGRLVLGQPNRFRELAKR